MAFVMEKAQEDKRLIDVAAMKRVRPPRVGDRCIVKTDTITGFPLRAIPVEATIADIDPENNWLRFVDKNNFLYEKKIDSYLRGWQYADD